MPYVKERPFLKKGRAYKKPNTDLGPHSTLQYNVNKELKADKKVRPQKVFQNYKEPKSNSKKNK
jgi:hypothetical protein